ncbi:MAG: hypothetical protein JWN51_757 [Phycisphaerales bacterium]|nr:hypothetical protein [Phycisphaerales bacterium]
MDSASATTHRLPLGARSMALCICSLLGVAGLGCGTNKNPAPATEAAPVVRGVPANLRVDGPEILAVHAQGAQIYTCQPDAAGKLAWKLKAPDATFTGGAGVKGKHYAGPTWECTTDGSKVVARKVADHPSPAPDSVPWLLLEATTHSGSGILSQVIFIQRINTIGGKAPPVADAKPGDETRVPYTADYVFYGPGATTQPGVP